MENEKRLTWKRSLDGYTDVGLCDGVTVDEAICKLADLEEKNAVEVVRCKDCKHYWKNVNTPGFDGKCTTVGDDDFCSDGERKDNETL